MTNFATLRNGAVATLVASGPYSAEQISTCDYGVVERSSGCAIIIHPEEGDFEPVTFGGQANVSDKWAVVKFNIENYIQFTGDSQKYLNDVWTAMDDLKTTYGKDDTLQSSACFAWLSNIRFNIDEGYEMGGKDWGLVRATLTIHDL